MDKNPEGELLKRPAVVIESLEEVFGISEIERRQLVEAQSMKNVKKRSKFPEKLAS